MSEIKSEIDFIDDNHLSYAQSIEAKYEYASLGARFSAFVIDHIILTLCFVFPNMLLVGFAENGDYYQTYMMIVEFVYGIACAAYFVYFESSSRQATHGKKKMGIYVADSEGAKLSSFKAMVRFVFMNIPMFTGALMAIAYPAATHIIKPVSLLLWYGGCFVAIFHPRKRTLHDILAGTYVLKGKPEGLTAKQQ